MIKCPNCSANLEYKVEDGKIFCEYCGSKFDPKGLDTKIGKAEEYENVENFNGKSYCCQDCGATLLSFDETAITFCSYCGSQAMIESKMIKINNPDYIIPFKKTKEECIKNYKKKLRHSFFAPSYMKSDIVVSKFRGIYLPYGVYKLNYNGKFSNTGSKYSHRSGDYVYYDDYSIVADSDAEYEGISFDLLSIYYDKYSYTLPFDYRECEKFNPNYLAGFYADTKDVTAETYDVDAGDVVSNDCKRLLKKNKKYKKYGCKNPVMPIAVSQRKTGMFPVYFLAIRDKKEEHVNYAVINGQTGKVAASLPLDFKKYLLVTIILSILFYLIIDKIGVLFLPTTIVDFSILASIISIFVSNRQLDKLVISKEHYDDLGYMSKKNSKNYIKTDKFKKGSNSLSYLLFAIFCFLLALYVVLVLGLQRKITYFFIMFAILPEIFFFTAMYFVVKFIRDRAGGKQVLNIKSSSKKKNKKGLMPMKEKIIKYLYKQLIAIALGIIVLIINPVKDIYYYEAGIVAFIIIIVSFYDIFKEHNEIVSNRLPQLEVRGGDENE